MNYDVESKVCTDVIEIPEGGIEDISDGYHTFKDLYYQRMVLFATLVKQNKELAWKSLRHEDGELCFGGDWFIVGIDTPEGSYTYHYEKKFWSMFDCQEFERGKHWDGHTDKDVTRLLSLISKGVKHGEWIDCDAMSENFEFCNMCGWENDVGARHYNFCPNCGAEYQAFVDLGVTRLSAHIFNLRKIGYIIKSDRVCVKNRYGQKTYVSEYQLGEDKNAIISS